MASMTQFKKRTHRAKTRLEAASPFFKWMFKACEQARIKGVDWPAHVFCTADAVEELAVTELEKGGALKHFLSLSTSEQINLFSCGLMFATWRMTQGIYRFDADIFNAVTQTKSRGKIPASVLRCLPQWCVYIETPGLTCDFGTGETQLHGFWALFALTHGRELLTIYTDVEGERFDDIMPPTIHIDTTADTIEQGIETVIAELGKTDDELAKKIDAWMAPLINLLLYLCADSEIMHKNKIEEPVNPRPKKTKKGWRLFQAPTIKSWDVGVRMGAAIRQATTNAEHSEKGGSKKRAHIRDAHWHTIVSGKRKDEDGNTIPTSQRNVELRWLPPTLVNADNSEELPATIRTVK